MKHSWFNLLSAKVVIISANNCLFLATSERSRKGDIFSAVWHWCSESAMEVSFQQTWEGKGQLSVQVQFLVQVCTVQFFSVPRTNPSISVSGKCYSYWIPNVQKRNILLLRISKREKRKHYWCSTTNQFFTFWGLTQQECEP